MIVGPLGNTFQWLRRKLGLGLDLDVVGRVRLARVRKEMPIVMHPGAGVSAPTSVFKGLFQGERFAVGDELYLSAQELPHDIDLTVGIEVILHYGSGNTTAARYVKFEVAWASIAVGEVCTATGGTLTPAEVVLSTTADALNELVAGTIPPASLTEGDHLAMRIKRVASAGTAPTPVTGDPYIVHAELEYTADRMGEAV